MSVLDKIKNALFEVEYVEVEEPEKKEKKQKNKDKTKVKESIDNKPIAKRVVLPEKKTEKVEEIEEVEEERENEDLETKSHDDTLIHDKTEDFKFMDDKDFRVDEEELEVLDILENENKINSRSESRIRNRQSRENFYDDNNEKEQEEEYDNNENKISNNLYSKNVSSKPYGIDKSYDVPIHEYGTYEKIEEKGYFKPSPIISPIYGILDKNYKKEDVVQKRQIRLSNFSRSNVSVDDIRNKAYGSTEEEEVTPNFEVEEENDDDLLVDLSDDKGKPEVKELTMGDALEYFQDLGLEYNVDYVDASKGKTTSRRAKDNYDDIENMELPKKDISNQLDENIEKEKAQITHNIEEENVVQKPYEIEEKNEKKIKEKIDDDDDDNLFDLIDSMYQESE